VFKNARYILFAALLPILATLTGCGEPGETIFGTPVNHALIGYNRSDFNVEVFVSTVYTMPAADADWQDVPAASNGGAGRATWNLVEGRYYVYARYNARPEDVYLKGRQIILDSNNHNRLFEGHEVGATMEVTPGHFTFQAATTPPPAPAY
jgi:hypothetical protein